MQDEKGRTCLKDFCEHVNLIASKNKLIYIYILYV
jgi:hypothetical protein